MNGSQSTVGKVRARRPEKEASFKLTNGSESIDDNADLNVEESQKDQCSHVIWYIILLMHYKNLCYVSCCCNMWLVYMGLNAESWFCVFLISSISMV